MDKYHEWFIRSLKFDEAIKILQEESEYVITNDDLKAEIIEQIQRDETEYASELLQYMIKNNACYYYYGYYSLYAINTMDDIIQAFHDDDLFEIEEE